jgi:cytidine deaminase
LEESTVAGNQSGARPEPQLSAQNREALLKAAKAALARAYAPYSKFKVGAAVLTDKGAIYSGCNVENASYGLTNCAERTAIFSAAAAEGPRMRIRAIAVWSAPEGPCAPCGACRQVIWEFGQNAIVLFQDQDGDVRELGASELLPFGFVF